MKYLLGLLIVALPLAAVKCGEFYGGVEALYWKTTHCPIPFAVGTTFLENGGRVTKRTFFNLKGDYDWGVRARVGYAQSCWFADVGYLWFEATDHLRVSSKGLDALTVQGTEFSVNLLRTHLRFRYQHADVRFGAALHKSCCCDFRVYGHARWIEIDFSNCTGGAGRVGGEEGVITAGAFDQAACLQAGGPGVGLMGQFCICNGFTAGGRLGAMAMIGRSRLERATVLSILDLQDSRFRRIPQSRTCIVPGAELDLHVGYSRTCGCTDLGVVVGYEMDYYIDALTFSTSVESSDSVPPFDCQNVGFGGPYIGIRVRY